MSAIPSPRAPSRSMRSVATLAGSRTPVRPFIDVSSVGHRRWHSSLISWLMYASFDRHLPAPMRALRFFFRLLFIVFAVLGGAMVLFALTVYIGWRLLPTYGKSVPDKTLLTLDIGDGVVERE